MSPTLLPTEDLGSAMADAYPELAPVAHAAGDARLPRRGRGPRPPARAAAAPTSTSSSSATRPSSRPGSAPNAVEHERFGTAKAILDGHEVDIAGARAESYPEPGALPVVEPAAETSRPTSRGATSRSTRWRCRCRASPSLIDPHGGRRRPRGGPAPRSFIRGSFRDDPTRALRAARYAARFGFELESETEALRARADLAPSPAIAGEADLVRVAAEPEAVRGLGLLVAVGADRAARRGARARRRRLRAAGRTALASRSLRAPRRSSPPPSGRPGAPRSSPRRAPSAPRRRSRPAAGRDPVELVLARAMGAEWLDRYLLEWRDVALEIDGADLIAAGVPEGPAVGRGLAAALRHKLDGGAAGREPELEVALAAAGGTDGVA